MPQRIDEILLCANYHWPRLQIMWPASMEQKKELKIVIVIPTNTQNMSERHMQQTNQQSGERTSF